MTESRKKKKISAYKMHYTPDWKCMDFGINLQPRIISNKLCVAGVAEQKEITWKGESV